MNKKFDPPFDAGDRVALRHDRQGLKRGHLGTVTKRMTIRAGMSVSPDPSGHMVFVVFDEVIGMQSVPVEELEKAQS